MTTLLRTTSGRRLNIPVWAIAALVVVNLLLVVACGLALRRNAELRSFANQYMLMLGPARGSIAPPLVGEDGNGKQQTIAYQLDKRPTLVYTFTKGCPHCRENWGAIRSLQALEPDQLRIVYVNTSDKLTPEYLQENGMARSVSLFRLEPQAALAYQARLVPQLEMLDRAGKVLWAKIGELTPNDIAGVVSLVGSQQKD